VKITKGAGSVIQAHDQGRGDGKLQPLRREDGTCQMTIEIYLFGHTNFEFKFLLKNLERENTEI
jgi:hypothetical protein